MDAQGLESFGQRLISRIYRGFRRFRALSQRGGGNQTKRCKSNRRLLWSPFCVLVGKRREILTIAMRE